MNKYKLQFNSHLGSSDLSAIPCENHCQFTVQAHSCLDCVISRIFIHLPSVLGSFFQNTSTLLAIYFPLRVFLF